MKISQIFESIEESAYSQPFHENFSEYKFYHGSERWPLQDNKINFKMREAPRNTFLAIHNAINTKAKEKFGIPIRNLLFAHGTPKRTYGRPFEIIPKGSSYRIFVSPNIYDLTTHYSLDTNIVLDQFEFFMLNGEDQSFVDDDTMFKIESHIKESGITSMNTFDEIQDTILSYVESLVEDKETFNIITSLLKKVLQRYEDIAMKYVDSCIEIKSNDNLTDEIHINSEFMIYAPDNFYIIPNEDD